MVKFLRTCSLKKFGGKEGWAGSEKRPGEEDKKRTRRLTLKALGKGEWEKIKDVDWKKKNVGNFPKIPGGSEIK